MSKTTNSFFIGECSRIGSVAALPDKAGGRELSPRIITAIAAANESLGQTTARLLRLAETAYGQRDYAALQELSDAMLALPFTTAQNAGHYYQAIIIKRQGDLERAANLLSTINAPRAIHTLGTIEECRGNWTEATRLHVEAMRQARGVDPFTVVSAGLQLAAISSFDGDHAGSLHAFQSLWPVVRLAAQRHPHLYPLWCNALAIEFAELGRIDEARQAVAVAIASPVAEQYPEWQETADELCQVERAAIVAVEPQVKSQAKILIALAVHLRSLVIGCQLLVVSFQRRAVGAPWAGILERVKLSARDRDGPFEMPVANSGIKAKAGAGKLFEDQPGPRTGAHQSARGIHMASRKFAKKQASAQQLMIGREEIEAWIGKTGMHKLDKYARTLVQIYDAGSNNDAQALQEFAQDHRKMFRRIAEEALSGVKMGNGYIATQAAYYALERCYQYSLTSSYRNYFERYISKMRGKEPESETQRGQREAGRAARRAALPPKRRKGIEVMEFGMAAGFDEEVDLLRLDCMHVLLSADDAALHRVAGLFAEVQSATVQEVNR